MLKTTSKRMFEDMGKRSLARFAASASNGTQHLWDIVRQCMRAAPETSIVDFVVYGNSEILRNLGTFLKF